MDKSLAPINKFLKEKVLESLKKTKKYWYSLRKELAVTFTGCIFYDNNLLIPRQLKQLVIDAIQQTHPGQAALLSLGNLLCFRCIHRCLTAKAQTCDESIKQGKNFKQISQKQKLGKLPTLSESIEEHQMDFAGPIPLRNHTNNYYILVSVDRYSRFPAPQLFKD